MLIQPVWHSIPTSFRLTSEHPVGRPALRRLASSLDSGPPVFTIGGSTGGNSSVGRAQPCQGWGREFESRFPLQTSSTTMPIHRRRSRFAGAEWQSGHAAACKAVYAGSIPTSASTLFTLLWRLNILRPARISHRIARRGAENAEPASRTRIRADLPVCPASRGPASQDRARWPPLYAADAVRVHGRNTVRIAGDVLPGWRNW